MPAVRVAPDVSNGEKGDYSEELLILTHGAWENDELWARILGLALPYQLSVGIQIRQVFELRNVAQVDVRLEDGQPAGAKQGDRR